MDLDVSTWMMLFFILFMIIGIWKIYVFLPNKQLSDDDTTKASQDELMHLMLKVIKENSGDLSELELLHTMKEDASFNKNHFWRFNQNRLEHLLNYYYIKNPHTKNIKDIWHVETKN